MDKVKNILILLLSIMLVFSSCTSAEKVTDVPQAAMVNENLAAAGEKVDNASSISGNVTEISKYGNIYLDIRTDELPFALGDTVMISVNGNEIAAPAVTSYSDVDNGNALVKIDGENVEVALSYADFAGTYAVTDGSEVTLTLMEEGGELSAIYRRSAC